MTALALAGILACPALARSDGSVTAAAIMGTSSVATAPAKTRKSKPKKAKPKEAKAAAADALQLKGTEAGSSSTASVSGTATSLPARKSYTCPMDGGHFDKPGKCPKCGMDLLEEKI
jgi:hypothetical protein